MKLFPYQKKGVRKITHFKGRALLADEMGLGKTLQALEWIVENPQAQPALVVCPAHLKWMWERACAERGLMAQVLSGMKPTKKGIDFKTHITIINYSIFKKWRQILKRSKFQTMIIDESHFLKNRKAIRTKAVTTFSKKIPYITALSGTPILNAPAEIWTIINILRPDLFPSFFAFARRYCKPILRPWGWEYKGSTHAKELHLILKRHVLIRRKKIDVLPELPEKTRTIIPVEIPMREYNKAKNHFISWLKSINPGKASRAKKAQTLTQLGYLKRLAAKLKYDMVKNWIDSFLEESDEKLVVFGVHKSIVRRLHNEYKKNSVIIDGNCSESNKEKAVSSFQNRDKIRLFFGNIQAAGTGITLTASSKVLFAELDWTPNNHTQAEDRIHRIGQAQLSQIYYMIAKGTIEEMLCGLIQKKMEMVSATIDGTKETDFNVHDKLLRLLKKEMKKE